MSRPSPKVLFLTKYARNGASSRYRTFQYLPWFDQAGIHYTLSPLFDDAYLAHKYAHGRAHPVAVLRAFMHRFWTVLAIPRNSTVVIEYELIQYFPALLERWLAWRGCRMVVDYDDALFHQYDTHPSPWVRRLLGGKIAEVMRLAHIVVVGNAYLANYARLSGARRVRLIPTVVDLSLYTVKNTAKLSTVFTIGWIGSPTRRSSVSSGNKLSLMRFGHCC